MPKSLERPVLLLTAAVCCLGLLASSAPGVSNAAPSAAPVNSVKPAMSGLAQVGQTLQVSTGTWSSTPFYYEFAWHRCNSSGNGCSLSPTTSGTSSYVVTAGDLGFTIVAQVAPDGLWTSSANGSASAVVVAAPSSGAPLNSVRPAMSGSSRVGELLQVSTGSWSPTPSYYEFAWHRCNSSGNACQLSSTTSGTSSYLVTAADVGFTIVAQVAPNGLWASSANGPASAVVAVATGTAGTPLNSVRPALSGSAQVGQTLQVSTGSWSSTPSYYEFAWHRCNSSGNACQLSPTTSGTSSYRLTAGDAGFTLVAQVAPNGLWGSSANTVPSAAIASAAPPSGPPVNSVRPVLSGSAVVGQTLQVSSGSWSPAASSYAYAWHRCNAGGTNCQLSPTSTSTSSYQVTSADVGFALVAQVAPNGLWGSSANSAPSALVAGPAPSGSGVIEGIGLLRTGNKYGSGSNYDRYAYVIVGRGDAATAAKLPGKALVYMSGTDVPKGFDTGVPYNTALANGWLVRDGAGNLMTGYGGTQYLGDLGSAGYQQAWLANVSSFLQSTGSDGVFIDDVLGNISTWSDCRCFPPKYPSLAAWQNATVAFMQAVGPALKARGFYVLSSPHTYTPGDGGSDDGSLQAAWWRQIAPTSSGLMNEYWSQNGANSQSRSIGPSWNQQWDNWQKLVSVAQDGGADFFGIAYGSSSQPGPIRYAKGSFLLDWHGRGGAVLFDEVSGLDPWNPYYTADIGDPLGAKTQIASNVWQRQYSAGTVVVNANPTAVTVTVNGTSRTIAATDALILAS